LTVTNNFNTYSAGYLKTPGPVHEADFLLSLAMDWITERKQQDQPYVARVEMWGPHHSYQVPLEIKDTIDEKGIEEYPSFRDEMPGKPQFSRDFLQKIRNRNPLRTWEEWQPVMKRAYESYSYIDQAVGKFLDQLEQTGMADNTIVIMTADHGDSLGSHGGMVDKAGDMMEELMHIPMVIRWPGITKGNACDALVSNLDLVPTVLDLAGIVPPDHMDGKSLAPLLQGDRSGERADFMAEHYGHFKVHAAQRTLYWQHYKYIATEGDVHELYDLKQDSFELTNLVDRPEMKHIADELRQRLLSNMDRYGDTGEDTVSLRNAIQVSL
jgi:arylsulfatase A-like enzyme